VIPFPRDFIPQDPREIIPRSYPQRPLFPGEIVSKGSCSQEVSFPRNYSSKRYHSQEKLSPRDIASRSNYFQDKLFPRVIPQKVVPKRSHP
jgi:hypothetical protein